MTPPYGAYPPPPPAPAPAPVSRNTWLIPVLAVAMVSVVAGAALLAFLFLREEDPGAGGPATLRRPVQFLTVRAAEPAPCKAGLLADPSGAECLQVGTGMEIARVDDIRVQPPDPARGRTGYSVAISFTPEDARTFTGMTTTAAQAQSPANRIAIIAEGRVLSAPAVSSPITGGRVEISGPADKFTRDYTTDLVRRITGR
ncbi:hypothetical protein ACFY4C_35625 [Actinomadura viridis]|uniref:SecDF P1 head subdomain-containing protein n=1 Tax=Actinomadura viridis TaxID=58110 RepID=UPI0036AD9E95